MTQHTKISLSDRTLLPRALIDRRPSTPAAVVGGSVNPDDVVRIYFSRWKFKIGQIVDYCGEEAVITARQRTGLGRHLYAISESVTATRRLVLEVGLRRTCHEDRCKARAAA